MLSRFAITCCVVLCALVPQVAHAHGDLSEQIAALDQRIAQAPTDAALYLRRGGLHRLHEDFDLALADYERAAQLDPSLDTAQLAKGQVLFEAGWPRSARTVLDAYISKHPDTPTARLLRARVLFSLGNSLAAAEDYTHAIQGMETPKPDYYLERAKVLAALGGSQIDKAIASLDAGISRLGPLITLQVAALDLEIKHKRVTQSLARLDFLIANSARKDMWLFKRGSVLDKAGRTREAHEAYRQALHAMGVLSPRQQNTKATRTLKSNVLRALEESSARETSSSKGTATAEPAARPFPRQETKYE